MILEGASMLFDSSDGDDNYDPYCWEALYGEVVAFAAMSETRRGTRASHDCPR